MNLLTKLNQANERGEFEPGSYPIDEDVAKFVQEHIEGFRKVLQDSTVDEFLKDNQVFLKKFDKYFS